MQNSESEKKKITTLFENYDLNRNNYLDKEGLKSAIFYFIEKMGIIMPKEEKDSVATEAFEIYSNEGKIFFSDFSNLVHFFQSEKGLAL